MPKEPDKKDFAAILAGARMSSARNDLVNDFVDAAFEAAGIPDVPVTARGTEEVDFQFEP